MPRNTLHVLNLRLTRLIRQKATKFSLLVLAGVVVADVKAWQSSYHNKTEVWLAIVTLVVAHLSLLGVLIARYYKAHARPQRQISNAQVRSIIDNGTAEPHPKLKKGQMLLVKKPDYQPIITKGAEGELYTFHLRDYLPEESERFEFAPMTADPKLPGVLNYIMFRRSNWGVLEEGATVPKELKALGQKIARNAAHIAKNPHSFLLVKDAESRIIGFSHILVVTKPCWKHYVAGEISDMTFSADHIAADAADAYGILIFTFGYLKAELLHKFIREIGPACSRDLLTSISSLQRLEKDEVNDAYIVCRATAYHTNELLRHYFPEAKTVPFLVQVEEERLIKLLKKSSFRKLENRSKDACPILTTDFKIKREILH